MSNPPELRSGRRKKKLTERFQQYLEQVGDSSTSNKKNKRRYNIPPPPSPPGAPPHQGDDFSRLEQRLQDQQNSVTITVPTGDTDHDNRWNTIAGNHTTTTHPSTSKNSSNCSTTTERVGRYSRSNKKGGTRVYTCRHCGFMDTSSNTVKMFMQNHHQLPENSDCYKYGLIHCPNTSCKRVFITEKDMELHCSMTRNSSKNPCLNAFNEMKAIENDRIRHNSTQVDAEDSMPDHVKESFPYMDLPNFLGNYSHLPVHGDNFFVTNQPPEGYAMLQSHYYNIMQSHLDKDGTNQLLTFGKGEKYSTHLIEGNLNKVSSRLQQEETYGNEDASFHIYNEEQSSMNTSDDEDFLLDDDANEDVDANEEVVNPDDNPPPLDDVSSSSLSSIQDEFNKASCNMTFSNEFNTCFELEHMLREAGSPVYLYDKILKWAIHNKSSLPSSNSYISRQELMKRSAVKVYGKMADKMKPKETQCILPSGRMCGVTTFNVLTQIASLLSDSSINTWDNYFFNPKDGNPFHINTFTGWDDDGHFNDIETGIWYARTQQGLRIDKENEILVPLCLFIDGTVLSISGSLSLEPVMLSVMLHNRETRKNPKAWRPIGYINDPSSIPGKKYSSTVEKYEDYHFMLSSVLTGIREIINNREGYHWQFNNVPGVEGIVQKKLIFSLAYVIGDTKGHHLLCGRMGSHNFTTGLCRDCDMTTQNSDNPTYRCNFLSLNITNRCCL